MKNFMLVSLFALCAETLVAQFTITGTIRDKTVQLPLSRATLELDGSVNAVSGADGSFRFTGVSAGSHTLRVRHVGYHTQEINLTLSSDHQLIVDMEPAMVFREPVEITATRAHDKSAMAWSVLTKAEIETGNTGKDVPFLLETLPSVVATSDAGNGVGYTGIRIRGTDASRINVTMDGIPVNDSESQLLYWVDLPDVASSVEDIQVQRGVGTSTNGAGAFGGSVNIRTSAPSEKPFLTTSTAYGSFNTLKTNAAIGTGMIGNRWNFEGRLSKISSDGYIDRATSDLKSIYIAGSYFGKNNSIRMQVISGKELTYQSWYGVPEAALDTNRTWNYYTYENQVDDYQQDHYRLFYTHALTKKAGFQTAFHYTYGRGFYEEYKEGEALEDYLLQPVVLGTDTVTHTDLVRRKWLDNDFYGVTYSLNYAVTEKNTVIVGGAWNRYDGDHFGKVIWARYASNGGIHHRYYDNNGLKTDFNIFTKITWNVVKKLDAFADFQYRRVLYDFEGINDDGTPLEQSVQHDFINPKAGITYTLEPGHYTYLSFSTGNREPSRDDYTESNVSRRPEPERLYDFEAGYRVKRKSFSAGFNYYLMLYDNQLVLTGEVNDVGNYTRTNIKNSRREGIELEAGYASGEKWRIAGHATLSRNTIDTFREYIDDYDQGGQVVILHRKTDIAFSPRITAGLTAAWKPVQPLSLSLSNRYVGKQYLDNTSNSNRALDPYVLNDFRITYTVAPKFIRQMEFTFLVNNLLDMEYESNGYTFSYIYGGEKSTENYYYPQAGRHFTGMVTLKF